MQSLHKFKGSTLSLMTNPCSGIVQSSMLISHIPRRLNFFQISFMNCQSERNGIFNHFILLRFIK